MSCDDGEDIYMKLRDGGSNVSASQTNCSQDWEKGFTGGRKRGHNSEQSCGTEQSPASAKVLT